MNWRPTHRRRAARVADLVIGFAFGVLLFIILTTLLQR